MKKVVLLALSVGFLAGCGAYEMEPVVRVGASANDSKSSVTVTKTVTPANVDAGTPEKVEWKVGPSGAVVFTFSSRPGSQAGYIRGYKVTRDVVNGRNMAQTPPLQVMKADVYVPSGFTCADVSATQSCSLSDPSTSPANGVETAPYSVDFAAGLADEVIATNSSVSRVLDVTFVGVSSTGQPFEVPITNVVASGIKAGDE